MGRLAFGPAAGRSGDLRAALPPVDFRKVFFFAGIAIFNCQTVRVVNQNKRAEHESSAPALYG